uniref:Putative ribonuclease H-like domain-containing protein n=1 Tax=Tanacetum cinerariifolium TaxID=118510 RepID=A0A699GTJ5_TANCI|nr:putative ribonuclease H-like domain-containing protein [Tanacetum cinerariifolium]
MHTRASNSELVKPLHEPESTLNQRLLLRNKRVPFEKRNDPPQQPRVVYAPILDINYFRHFLVTLQNLNPMDDKPMCVANCVVSLTLDFAITIPETANEFAIKGSDDESDNVSVHNEATNTPQQPNIQPQIITTVSNNNAKFSYLKKDKYEESKARTTLLQSIPDDHVADFHYMDDARDIWNVVKDRFGGNVESKKMRKSMMKQEFLEFRISEAEGLHKGYDRMQKIMSQLNQLKAKPEDEDINLKLELLSFDDLYYKLKTLEVDVKGYSTFSSNQSAGPSYSAFISTTSASKKMSYKDSLNYYSTTTYSIPSNSKTGSHRSGNVIEDVLQSFVADTKPEQQLAYEDFKQIEKNRSGRDGLKMANGYDFYHDGKSDGVIASKEFGMIDGCDIEDAIEEGAAKIYNLSTGADTEEAGTAGDAGEFALMGVTSERVLQRNQLTLEDKIRVLSIELENTSNLLKHSERINADVKTAKKDLQTKLDNHLIQTEKWRNSSKNLFRLIDSSMSTSFHRFAKAVKVVPPPLFGDYASLSDHSDMDESHMSYGTKSSTYSASKSVSNDFVSCDDSDKSLEVNTNDFASSDSSVKSSELKPNDSTSCASTSIVYISKHEAEIESNVGTPIQEPIIFVPQALLLRTGKVNIPHARPQPVPTSKPKVFASVPTGIDRQLLLSPQQVVHGNHIEKEHPFLDAEVKGIFDSGYSRSMASNKERLDDFQVIQGRKVMFGGGEDTGCLVLCKDFKLLDDNMVVLKVPRKHNLYTINLNNLCPRGNLACLVAHASVDEFVKWHRRMGHVNDKNMNRLVKGNLVRGLPPKLFKNDHTCVACCKGKQHKASYKAINAVSSIYEPLQLLHMDLFGPTSIRSIDNKYYCLVITNGYSRFCWVFFLEHKDATYPILRDFINLIENQLNKKVKAIRCDNGTEFKNAHMIELCGSKGRKREFSNARTPQQNGVAERKNRTLIEAVRTMLADSKLPTMFWTEAIRTACYVLNRVLVTSPRNKTPYALLTGNIPSVGHFKPFKCHVTILNTSDHLGKFDGKADEGYIVGYSASNKAYRVYNVPNKRVEESMNLRFLEEKPNVQGLGHECIQGTEPKDTFGDDSLLNSTNEIFQKELARLKGQEQKATSNAESLGLGFVNDVGELQKNASAKTVPTGSVPVPTGYIPVPAGATVVSTDDVLVHTSSLTDSFYDDEPTIRFPYQSDLGNHDPSPGIFSSSSFYDDEFGAALDNVASTVEVSPVATTRINTIHPQSLIIGDPTSAVQTRSKVKQPTTGESAFISYSNNQQRDNHTDF